MASPASGGSDGTSPDWAGRQVGVKWITPILGEHLFHNRPSHAIGFAIEKFGGTPRNAPRVFTRCIGGRTTLAEKTNEIRFVAFVAAPERQQRFVHSNRRLADAIVFDENGELLASFVVGDFDAEETGKFARKLLRFLAFDVGE